MRPRCAGIAMALISLVGQAVGQAPLSDGQADTRNSAPVSLRADNEAFLRRYAETYRFTLGRPKNAVTPDGSRRSVPPLARGRLCKTSSNSIAGLERSACSSLPSKSARRRRETLGRGKGPRASGSGWPRAASQPSTSPKTAQDPRAALGQALHRRSRQRRKRR